MSDGWEKGGGICPESVLNERIKTLNELNKAFVGFWSTLTDLLINL